MKAQSDDYSTLTGRAKDLIGLATVATTIASVILNEKVFAPAKLTHVPKWWAFLSAASVAAILLAGIYSLWPRVWYFSPDPAEVYATVVSDLTLSTDALLASVANGIVLPDVVVTGKSALEWNDAGLARIRWAVVVQVCGYLALGGAAAALTLQQVM